MIYGDEDDNESVLESLKRGWQEVMTGQVEPVEALWNDIAVDTSAALTTAETAELENHEAVIERGLQTFYEVGTALLAIRDKRLYRAGYPTFEAYCQERWDMRRRQADRLIAAAETVGNLRPIGLVPEVESHVRPLTTLEPEAQRIVWEVVQQTAPAGKVTAAHVKSVAQVFKEIAAAGESIDPAEVAKAAVNARKTTEKEQRKAEKLERQTTVPADLPDVDDRYRLIAGDMRLVLPQLPDESFEAIITDPPYPQEFLDLYDVLAREGARLLKPGGIMAVMCGQSYLPQIMTLMSLYLEYHWTYAYLTPGGQSPQIWPRKVNTFWKPVLTFTKGAYAGDWTGDVIKSDANDKRFHEWGQSESGTADMLTRFTLPGQRILDPFLGGGTTALVALQLNRLVTGVDSDHRSIETTKARIAAWNSQ